MAWKCASCGSDTSRSVSTYNDDGSLKSERCPACKPESFEGAFVAPSDQKIWSGPQAMPTLYKLGADGTYHAKDELIADTVSGWDQGPTEAVKARKRATRRTEPLTPEELERSIRWGKEVLAPALQRNA